MSHCRSKSLIMFKSVNNWLRRLGVKSLLKPGRKVLGNIRQRPSFLILYLLWLRFRKAMLLWRSGRCNFIWSPTRPDNTIYSMTISAKQFLSGFNLFLALLTNWHQKFPYNYICNAKDKMTAIINGVVSRYIKHAYWAWWVKLFLPCNCFTSQSKALSGAVKCFRCKML